MTRSPFQEALKLPLFVPVLRDRLLCHPHSIVPDKRFQNRWSIHANQEQNDLFSLFSRQKTMFFRSQDDWLSKRSRGSDLKTPENDSESPSLSDHFYFSYKLLSVIYLYLYTQHCFPIFLLSHILLSEIRPNSVSHPAAGFFHTGPDEIALGFRISIPVVFETFL